MMWKAPLLYDSIAAFLKFMHTIVTEEVADGVETESVESGVAIRGVLRLTVYIVGKLCDILFCKTVGKGFI